MNKTDQIARATLASLITLGLAAAATPVLAAKGDFEKCAGIVKAGKNDCATSTNSCAGTATKDGDKEAWVYVPKGTCSKIVGGTILADAKKK
ncbi:MAG TPA: DUF2282 domain-containing protein [Methylophilaceae bacterium]|nr:DUF2282 domain-containing protein [Methylophilaceae bacterium]